MTAPLFARVVDSVTMGAWVTLLLAGVVYTAGEILGVFGQDAC